MKISDFNTVVELIKKGAHLEAQEMIMSLREGHLKLREENLMLRDENRSLIERLDAQQNIEFDHPYYWKNVGETKDGPFCQQCQDNDNKLIRLQKRSVQGAWDCLTCKSYFQDKNYVEVESSDYVQTSYF